MKYGKLIFTKRDHDLLRLILINWNISTPYNEANYHLLLDELKDAQIVDERDMPADIVKFQSYVDVETPFGLLENYELVVPARRDPQNKKLSILSPLGSAIIGYAESDEISWNFPAGKQIIKIKKVKNEVLV